MPASHPRHTSSGSSGLILRSKPASHRQIGCAVAPCVPALSAHPVHESDPVSYAKKSVSHPVQRESAAAQAPLLLASYSSPSRSPSSHFRTFHSKRPRQSGPRYAELAFNRSKSIPVESSLGFSTHENILARSGGHVAQLQLRLTLFEFHRKFQFQFHCQCQSSISIVNFTFTVNVNHISRISGTFLEPI